MMSATISTYKLCSVFLYQLFVGGHMSYLRYLCLFVGGHMSYLRYLCLFGYSGVQHILTI